MNNKKEGEYYYQMVRKYKDEYGGKNLKEFCKAETKFEENFYNQLAKLRHSGIDEKEIRKLLENIMRSLDSGKS